jgi:hypothetical protein
MRSPPLRIDPEPLFDEKGIEWSTEGIAFGKRLVSILVEIDKAAHGEREATPPPEWTKASEYRLESETRTEHEIRRMSKQTEELQRSRTELTLALEREGGNRICQGSSLRQSAQVLAARPTAKLFY